MAQYALPTSDHSHPTWVQGAGDGNSNHWEEVDEGFGAGRGSGSGPDDATTYWQGNGTDQVVANFLRSVLSSVTDPIVHTGHVVRTRNRKNSASGQQIDLVIGLWSSIGQIIGAAEYTNIDATWTTRSFTLTTTEAALITDYGALHMVTTSDEVGGGAGRVPQESAHEFECPNAGGGPSVVLCDPIGVGVVPFPR